MFGTKNERFIYYSKVNKLMKLTELIFKEGNFGVSNLYVNDESKTPIQAMPINSPHVFEVSRKDMECPMEELIKNISYPRYANSYVVSFGRYHPNTPQSVAVQFYHALFEWITVKIFLKNFIITFSPHHKNL